MINNYNPVTTGGVLPPFWDSVLIHKDVSGSIASFSDGADGLPLKSCVVRIEPVQASGTPSPETPLPISGWTGCEIISTGKNVLDCVRANAVGNSVSVRDGVLISPYHTTSNSGIVFRVRPNTTYVVGYDKIVTGNIYPRIAEYSDRPSDYDSSSCLRELVHENGMTGITSGRWTITTGSKAKYVFLGFHRSYNASEARISNLFANFVRSGETYGYTAYTGTTLPITFTDPTTGDPVTVYGGTITLNPDGSADVISTMGNIASYDGESLPGAWISSMDVYEEGATPTTGAQVVYELETPLTYHIENVGNLQTLLGVNNTWADTGDIDLTYYADATLAHEAQTAELQALILEQ